MRNVYKIESAQSIHNELHFSLNENETNIQIQPAGQVLTDSDNCSFIYLVEEGESYSYLSFPEVLWPYLVELLKLNEDPFLRLENGQIKLHNFTDELQMLIYNIKGNDNYGTEFVEAVEQSFQEILQAD